MIRPGKLHHASIRVGDLERSRKFYEDLLGFRRTPRPDLGFPGTWYSLGEGQLHLMETPKLRDDIDPSEPHFALEVEDYDGMKDELRSRGIEFFELGPQLWIRDPDGYVVELRRKE